MLSGGEGRLPLVFWQPAGFQALHERGHLEIENQRFSLMGIEHDSEVASDAVQERRLCLCDEGADELTAVG